jgi:hypothetical protein
LDELLKFCRFDIITSSWLISTKWMDNPTKSKGITSYAVTLRTTNQHPTNNRIET